MNRVTEMPTPIMSRLTRGMKPMVPTWTEEQDPAIAVQGLLGDWIKEVSENEALFKKFVYENDDIKDHDLRLHRSRICFAIANGELLAMALEQMGDKESFGLVDQRIKQLFEALIAWHASLDSQADIPESFKRASREVQEGKLVDLDI